MEKAPRSQKKVPRLTDILIQDYGKVHKSADGRPRKPNWTTADYVQLARFRREHPETTGPEILDAFWCYLKEQGKFYQGHPLRLFIREIDRFLDAAALEEE